MSQKIEWFLRRKVTWIIGPYLLLYLGVVVAMNWDAFVSLNPGAFLPGALTDTYFLVVLGILPSLFAFVTGIPALVKPLDETIGYSVEIIMFIAVACYFTYFVRHVSRLPLKVLRIVGAVVLIVVVLTVPGCVRTFGDGF